MDDLGKIGLSLAAEGRQYDQDEEARLKTWMLFNSEQPHAVRILEHYRKRFSNSGVELLFPLNDELVEELLPAIVYSLEHLRTRLIRGAILEIRVEENRVHVP